MRKGTPFMSRVILTERELGYSVRIEKACYPDMRWDGKIVAIPAVVCADGRVRQDREWWTFSKPGKEDIRQTVFALCEQARKDNQTRTDNLEKFINERRKANKGK